MVSLPRDYLSFLRIHNGFGKLSELGLLRSDQVLKCRQGLMEEFLGSERPLRCGNTLVDPGGLIPFYESGWDRINAFSLIGIPEMKWEMYIYPELIIQYQITGSERMGRSDWRFPLFWNGLPFIWKATALD